MKKVISKKQAKDLTEEEEILNNKDMMEQIKESEKNRKKGISYKLNY